MRASSLPEIPENAGLCIRRICGGPIRCFCDVNEGGIWGHLPYIYPSLRQNGYSNGSARREALSVEREKLMSQECQYGEIYRAPKILIGHAGQLNGSRVL